MGRLNFRGGRVQRESFLCMSGEKGSLLYTSQCEFGPGLWPRLVYTAGCFPERAAQGRGTCISLRQWSRREPDGRG